MRIIQVESSGDPSAISPVGARGLMQLMPIAVKEARGACKDLPDELDLLDPETNIRVGVCYLKGIRRFWKTTPEFLAFYNGGFRCRDAVRRGEEIPFQETRRYLLKFQGHI
jgi:soluble lytic murein transglycosylase-like protein